MEETIVVKDYQLEGFNEVINNEYSKFIIVKKVFKNEFSKNYGTNWSDVTLIIDDDAIELLFALGISFATKVVVNREF